MKPVKFDGEKFLLDKKVTDDTISECLAENAYILGYYLQQEVLWSKVKDIVKLQIETRTAELEIDIRDKSAITDKRVTDAQTKAQASVDKDIVKLKTKLIEINEQCSLYSIAAKAIDHKGRLLISLAALKRAEYDGPVGIKSTNAVSRANMIRSQS